MVPMYMWNVQVRLRGVIDPQWAWISEKGPWYINTTNHPPADPPEYDEDDFDDEGNYIGEYEEHVCHPLKIMELRETLASKKVEATFDIITLDLSPHLLRLTGYDRPLRKWNRGPRKVELHMTPDTTTEAAAMALGAPANPRTKRHVEERRETERLRR
jgi:hypothetical protein